MPRAYSTDNHCRCYMCFELFIVFNNPRMEQLFNPSHLDIMCTVHLKMECETCSERNPKTTHLELNDKEFTILL